MADLECHNGQHELEASVKYVCSHLELKPRASKYPIFLEFILNNLENKEYIFLSQCR